MGDGMRKEMNLSNFMYTH